MPAGTDAASGWVALAATAELPIAEAPVRAALDGIAEVRTVALPYKPLSPAEEERWAAALQGAAAILLRSGYVTASLLDRLPDLRVVAVHGAGVDPVDVAACTERGVRVTNAPGANADAVAEITRLPRRSLQRQLARQGVSLRALTDEARRDFVLAQLRDTGRTAEDIAALAGYSEPAHLHRAVRRWTGLNSSELR